MMLLRGDHGSSFVFFTNLSEIITIYNHMDGLIESTAVAAAGVAPMEVEIVEDWCVNRNDIFSVQEVKMVLVLGTPEQYFVTRPAATPLYHKPPYILVGSTPIVICPFPRKPIGYSFQDSFSREGSLPTQEVVSDGRNHFYVTRPCESTAFQEHVTIYSLQPVYLFTTTRAAEAYVNLNYAEFGASADYSCEYKFLHRDIYKLIVK